jgi:acetylornithine/N-succinyldiaminopimelate aminotransferase
MPNPIAPSLFADPRVAQAKELLRAALADHQKQITGVRPPDPERKAAYEELLKHFGAARGGALFFPYLGSGLGKGALVELADGSVKYDMISGIGVHYFGHSNPMLVDTGVEAAIRDTVMQGNLQQNVESAPLARTLVEMANRAGEAARIAHCFLTTSGAMANENALKIAFQKHQPATRVLAFSHGFAGRSMALSQMTDKAAYRVGLPKVLDVDYVPFYNPDQPEYSTAAAVNRLKEHLHRYPKQHACMWMELIQGEGGFYAGTREFFLPIIELLKENGVAVWFDEIQTFARTSQPFAFQHFGLDAHVDLLTVGKITQVCATLFTDAYIPKPGLVSQTFTASTSAILAAQAILDALKGEAASAAAFFGPTGRVMQVRQRVMSHLDRIRAAHPEWIKGPFGEGAMIAFTPFDGSEGTAKKLLMDLFEAGVVAFVCGANPARLRVLPPVGVITDGDIDAAMGIFESVLSAHAAGRAPQAERLNI